MTSIQPFEYANGQPLRHVTDEHGDPWFVAADVAAILGLGNPRPSLALLDEDERGVHSVDTPGGKQNLATISEAGLYSFILRSRKLEAKPFKRWVTHEVLPSIRRTGSYTTEPAYQLPQTYAEALKELAATVEAKEAAEQQALAATAYAEQLEPAATAWGEFMDADGAFDLNATAKILGTGRIKLMARLRADGVLTRDNLPLQRHVDLDRFTVKVGRPWTKPDGTQQVSRSTRVTAKGLDWLAARYAFPQQHSLDGMPSLTSEVHP